MVAGADSIDDLALLRHGGMGRLFARIYAPSTLGSFLRMFRFGHVRQLDAVAARFLHELSNLTPVLDPPACASSPGFAFVDVDDTVIGVHGHAKQGAGFGYNHVRGLNALLATLTVPDAAPVIVAQRLRKGTCASARGARRLVADAVTTARRILAPHTPVLVRMDSALCRCRHNADYAEVLVMPRSALDLLALVRFRAVEVGIIRGLRGRRGVGRRAGSGRVGCRWVWCGRSRVP